MVGSLSILNSAVRYVKAHRKVQAEEGPDSQERGCRV
jgi:hypothetical protein